jgi:hypothetical protein
MLLSYFLQKHRDPRGEEELLSPPLSSPLSLPNLGVRRFVHDFPSDTTQEGLSVGNPGLRSRVVDLPGPEITLPARHVIRSTILLNRVRRDESNGSRSLELASLGSIGC